MARYRLRSAHYIDGDKLLFGDQEMITFGDDRGTIVGDGTDHVIRWPTLEMIALDADAEVMLDKERARLAANQASMTPVEDLALSMDDYETRHVPGFPRAQRGEPIEDGSPARKVVKP